MSKDTTQTDVLASGELKSPLDNPITIDGAVQLVQSVFGQNVTLLGLSNTINNFDRNRLFRATRSLPNNRGKVIREIRGRSKRMDLLQFGLVYEDEVYSLFKEAVEKNSDYWLLFSAKDSTDLTEAIAVPSASRWNMRSNKYSYRVRTKIRRQLKNLRKATLVTLTYHEPIAEKKNPYPFLDTRAFVIMECWEHLKVFLDRVRKFRERRGLKWNYISTVVEFQKNGMLHFHIIFFGGYVAPIQTLVGYWEWSEPQGVDVEFRESMNLDRYLSKYLGKTKHCLDESGNVHTCYAWLYYFSVRLYNFRRKYALYLEQHQQKPMLCIGLVYVGDGQYEGNQSQVVPFTRYREDYGKEDDSFWNDD